MIRVTRLNGEQFALNPDLIERVEAHPDTDQFLRLDAGQGRVTMGPAEDDLSFTQDVQDGWCVTVPAGTWHDIINTGDEDMRLYVVYAPTHHKPGIVQKTSEDAEKDEEAGVDEPPKWSVQPKNSAPDKKA